MTQDARSAKSVKRAAKQHVKEFNALMTRLGGREPNPIERGHTESGQTLYLAETGTCSTVKADLLMVTQNRAAAVATAKQWEADGHSCCIAVSVVPKNYVTETDLLIFAPIFDRVIELEPMTDQWSGWGVNWITDPVERALELDGLYGRDTWSNY